MRKLAAFTVSFALGICLAQYLLPERLLLPVAAVFFAAACLALLLPGLWRKRVLLVGTGLALALGWNWLYSYAVRAPLAALSGSEGTASMTLLEYAVPTDYGAKVTVKLEASHWTPHQRKNPPLKTAGVWDPGRRSEWLGPAH